jgi:hypothetical protein
MRKNEFINQKVADRLREAADLLEQQAANPFRVNAYRNAADTVMALKEDLRDIVERKGIDGLTALPKIGRGIAAAISEILRTGSWSQLARLRGVLEPEKLFRTVPGIGPGLAKTIHETLHVDTLEALEQASQDGRLETVPGIGRRRATMIRTALESMLGRRRGWRRHIVEGPSINLLLDVDAEYRNKAMTNKLPTISPKRFNPEGKAWLPILHTQRDNWHFTVLFSNTARAHELGRTHDWVVIYFYDNHHEEGQHTVVTETRGPLTGRRVVRGRERESREYYAEHSKAS